MRKFLILASLLLLCVAGLLIQKPALAADPPLMEKGKVYAVLWTCLPQIGCASELLKVEHVRKDGWVRVVDRNGDVWTINPAQALAVKPHTEGRTLAHHPHMQS